MSAAAFVASFYSGKAEKYLNEVAAPGYMVVKAATERTKMVPLADEGAAHCYASAPMKAKRMKGHARGQMIPKGIQAEIHEWPWRGSRCCAPASG